MGGGGQTALHLASIAGHVDAVQSLIDLGADLNKVNDISSATPLHLAGTFRGEGWRGVVCKPFLRPSFTHICPTHPHTSPAMGRGTRERKLQVISALVAAGADCFVEDRYQSQPHHYAHDETMRLALKGPDFKLHEAILNREVGLLIQHLQALDFPEQVNEWGPDGNTPLHVAACVPCPSSVSALIQAGANPNERNEHGTTALHTAASVLSEEVASLLLHAGAAINGKSILVDEYSSKGVNWVESPAASPRGALSSPNIGSDGGGGGGGEGKPSPRSRKEYKDEAAAEHETALHVAVRKGALSMARFLLQRGAAVDSTDRAGKTSLHLALENLLEASRIGNAAETQGCLALVRLLLESGACPLRGNQVLGKQRTTVHWAVQHGHVDALEVLVTHTFGLTRQRLLDAQDERGVTALMLAAKEGKVGCLEAMLRNGADAGLRNAQRLSARDLAAAEGMAAALCIIDTFATFASMA